MNIFCINNNQNKKLQKKLTPYMNPKGHKLSCNLKPNPKYKLHLKTKSELSAL